MWVGKWPNYFWWGGIGQGEIKFSGGGNRAGSKKFFLEGGTGQGRKKILRGGNRAGEKKKFERGE